MSEGIKQTHRSIFDSVRNVHSITCQPSPRSITSGLVPPPLFSPLQFLTYLAEKEKLADENVGPGNCRLHGLGGKMNRKETECGVYKTARSGA